MKVKNIKKGDQVTVLSGAEVYSDNPPTQKTVTEPFVIVVGFVYPGWSDLSGISKSISPRIEWQDADGQWLWCHPDYVRKVED